MAIDSLFAGMESLDPKRMLTAFAPGPHVWHISDSAAHLAASRPAASDPATLLPRITPMWGARREFKVTWSLHDLRVLSPRATVAVTRIRFVATDTRGVTTTREGYWTLVFEKQDGLWKIVADHRSMTVVPPDTSTTTQRR